VWEALEQYWTPVRRARRLRQRSFVFIRVHDQIVI
jgi:hypothetical protein